MALWRIQDRSVGRQEIYLGGLSLDSKLPPRNDAHGKKTTNSVPLDESLADILWRSCRLGNHRSDNNSDQSSASSRLGGSFSLFVCDVTRLN